jgi:hypothetical protein
MVLTGCAPFGEPQQRKAGAPVFDIHDLERQQQVLALLAYARALPVLSTGQLEAERERLEATDPVVSDASIELALLYSDPRAPFHDLKRADTLLADYLASRRDVPNGVRDLALLVQRLVRANLVQAAELAEMRAGLESERRHRLDLQRKLDAIKSIEQDINTRTNPLPATEP